MLTQTIGFVGAGQMAKALAQGFVATGLVPANRIVACDPVVAARESFGQVVVGAVLAATNEQVVAKSDVVFLAVKPQSMGVVFDELAGKCGSGKLVVSIAAGVPIAKLTAGLKTERVARVMPNTPALVGQGASAFSLASGASPADGQLVGQLLEAVGQAFLVDEKLLDAVT